MKVVGVIGGPRYDGNTYKLTRAVLDGALEAGHTVLTWRLRDTYIGHLGYHDDELKFPFDDFEKMQPDLESMDALVLGAPIWYGQVDSRTLNFINRTYFYNKYHNEENAQRWPNAQPVNVITYGRDEPDAYDSVLEWLDGIWNWYGMKKSINLAAHGTGKNPVADNKELLKRSKEIGRNL
jgi:multimeric flavodoxin WrbA